MIAREWRALVNRHLIVATVTVAGMAPGTCVGDYAHPIQKETPMTARGTFDVKVTPQPQDDRAGGPFGRLFLDKQFHGDLVASSKGQMLGAGTGVAGSAGYVAFEHVTGTLSEKRGSFILQHKGTMRKDVYTMDVTIVPDSGTDQLSGIAGTMTIHVDGKDHSYSLEYTFETD
jgi:uncharacterized protein DUF3224